MEELLKLKNDLKIMRERHKQEAKPLVTQIHALTMRYVRKEKRVTNELMADIAAGNIQTNDQKLLALGALPLMPRPRRTKEEIMAAAAALTAKLAAQRAKE